MRKLAFFCIMTVLLDIISVSAQNAPLTDCDRFAAHPNDPQKKTSGVPFNKIDANAAVAACEEALRRYPNDIQFAFQLGRAYDKIGDVAAAVEQYKRAADQGYAMAQFNIASMYAEGRGVPLDYFKALEWYQKAADQGIESAKAAASELTDFLLSNFLLL